MADLLAGLGGYFLAERGTRIKRKIRERKGKEGIDPQFRVCMKLPTLMFTEKKLEKTN